MKMTEKFDRFKRFLINYVSVGHTYTDEAMNELEYLTNLYMVSLSLKNYYTEHTVIVYCNYLDDNMSEENHDFFHYYWNKDRYIKMTEIEFQRFLKDMN